jgi:hypothetical protein
MKIAAYYKSKGDRVKFYDPLLDNPDMVYASKIFNFTPDYQNYPMNIPICKGGTAYNLQEKLLSEIETMYPDYSLYNCGYAIGFTTRGCIRKCPFCLVPNKEGKVHVVGDIYTFWHGQSHVMLLDNNLTAMPEQFETVCKQLIKEKIKTDFSQGLDIRLVTPEMAQILSKVKLWKQIHFAFDNIKYESKVIDGINILVNNGVKKYKLMFFVLIGFNSTQEEDLYRVELLRDLKVDPFVMPFNKNDKYQKSFARWVNHKAIFKTVSWEDYKYNPKNLKNNA